MYWLKNPEDITFQFTVSQLTSSLCLPKENICVTVHVGDVSKITCSGTISEDNLTVTWNHPFRFSAPSNTSVQIAIWILPEELTHEWDKKPLGGQMVIDLVSLLESHNTWQCNVPGHSACLATLSIACSASEVLIAADGHNCLTALGKYRKHLSSLGRQSNNVASMKIEVDLARLDLCPPEHADHTNILHDLASAYSSNYTQNGDIANLNKLIEVQKRRLELCPLGHPEHVEALGSLAVSLQKCYYAQGDITVLNKAIELEERRLELCPKGHPCHDKALNNLAASLNARYQNADDSTDLDRIINLLDKYLEFHPLGHQDHGVTLQILSCLFWDHYCKTKDCSDLNKAINLSKKAIESFPVHHRNFAFNVSQLAGNTLLLSEVIEKPYTPDQSGPLVDEAFEAYRLLKKCGPAASLDLLEATQAWARKAEKHNHTSVLEAYQTLLKELDSFTSFSSSLDSDNQTLVADAANDALSCATRHSDLQMAVELSEQGRGILWNQLACIDISVAVLETQGKRECELAKKYTQLCEDLEQHAEHSVVGQGMDTYWRVKEEWQRVVDDIRRFDGFSRFLLPPQFDDLQRAAEYGPVIVVNASKYSCDALVVLCARAPIRVPLRCSLDDVAQLRTQLSELIRDSHAYGHHRGSYVEVVLRELWSSVVEPITAVLQNDVQLPLGSRIWWYPTSSFTLLPLHAAGPYLKGKKNLIDIYISSYAPSLSALLRAHDRIRSQRRAHDISGSQGAVSFAAVCQAHPSADTGLGQLPEVDHEIQRIQNETNMPANVTFETVTDTPTSVEGAVKAFRNHQWVHIACHGAQHATKPFDSWFAMSDGKLTLMRIIQERFTNSEFAFLSACHTAKGDAPMLDEVLHLAAGMQFAGFNGVIGTLWSVDDAIAHQVVTQFYKEMFKHPKVDFEHAAAALNTAVIETADEVPLEKRIMFVHIGI